MALVMLATAATVRVACDPTNTTRMLRRASAAVHDVALGTFDLMQGAYLRDSNILSEGVQSLGNAALATVDTVVYSVAVMVPIIPIGFTWATFRRHQ
jgi:hypothetical protein